MGSDSVLHVGWCEREMTPKAPVLISGQFHLRVSEGVNDPITATALVLADEESSLALVSCDLVCISDDLREKVLSLVREEVPELQGVVLNATHTHTAPETRNTFAPVVLAELPFPLGTMDIDTCVENMAWEIASAIRGAWETRAPASVGYGLTHAVIGHNRRWCREDGSSQMYGNTNDPAFSHIEGYEDHAVNVLASWDAQGKVSGLIVNVACPSQVDENDFKLSADYWHNTREYIAAKLGRRVPILAQCSAAGDQSPHPIVRKAAEERMWRLRGISEREEIARRLGGAVVEVLPYLEGARQESPVFRWRQERIGLPRRLLTAAEVDQSLAEADEYRGRFEEMVAKLKADPTAAKQPRWYVQASAARRRVGWLEAVKERYERQQVEPEVPVDVTLVRIGDMAMATNPFEYYLDFGMHIKARSPAVQTFLVQLAGEGTYLAPRRSLTGGSYGAVPASTVIGPEGGQHLAKRTVELLQELWAI